MESDGIKNLNSASVRINISFAYVIAFLLLLIVMMEMHEVVHITVGRWICGCWGPRDFNVWSLCEGCEEEHAMAWLATLAGPLFSFAMMWLGMYMLRTGDRLLAAWGFAFIFTNIPFGRITTVMMGGGDEMVVVRHFLHAQMSRTQMIVVGTLLVLLLGVPPIVQAYRFLTQPRAWLYILGFLTLPLAFLLAYTLTGLNTLLSHGVLAQTWIMGTPLLITLHTLLAALLFYPLRKHLFAFT